MKNIALLISFAVLFAYCSTKKNTSGSAAKKTVTADSLLHVAQKRWPNVTGEDLAAGKTIYEGKCTRCHGKKKITRRSEQTWLEAIKEMAPKSKLTAEEKEKLTRYILAYKEAHTTVKK